MKRRTKFVRLFCLISLGGILGGALLRGVDGVGALDYQSNVGVGFTFEPTLNVTLSNSDLVINNLSPNTGSDSNVITVNVATNAAYGYDLFSTVGNTANVTTELKDGGNSFASLSSNVATLASFDDNKWGYSYSTDSGSNWVSGDQGSTSAGYAGLPLYTGTGVKLASANSNAGSSVQFKIAAKAGATQASGTYTNVVNFYAVTNVGPMSLLDAFIASDAEQINGYYKMQDMTSSICNAVDNSLIPSELQLIDERDNKLYWVAKLADGNCWMTQNLDHDIVATENFYTYANTDIGHSAIPNTGAKWTGMATYATNDATWDWSTSTPESYDPGDVCWNGALDESWGTNLSSGTVACSSDKHYHIGNYYNWTAAVAMSDSSGYDQDGTDVNQSICPAGWMLPKSGGTLVDSGSFRYLVDQLSLTAGMSGNIQNSPVYFTYGGDWSGDSGDVGSYGGYWSSVVDDSDYAYGLAFNVDDFLAPQDYGYRYDGGSVRCVAR